MLVLSRKIEEGVRIGDNIEIRILDVFSTDSSNSKKSRVASIGISAPREINILRKELADTREVNLQAQESARAITGADLAGILKQKRSMPPEEKAATDRRNK